MRRSTILWTILGLACFTAMARGAMLQTDDFQSGSTEGWTDGVFMSPMVQLSGGPDGSGDAFLLVSSSSPSGPGSKVSTFNVGPDWVGDYASLNAGSVTVDLMNPTDSTELEMRLALFGPSSVNQRWTSTISAVVPNDGIWRNYEFSLAEDDLTLVRDPSNYDDLISNVLRIMLRHDAGAPSDEGTEIDASLGIDNVSLIAASPPLPADFDGDGDVDHADLAQWEGDFGVNADSDADGDLDSDGADFLVWQQQFGQQQFGQQQFGRGASDTTSLQTVPEPSAGILLYCGFAAIVSRSRRD